MVHRIKIEKVSDHVATMYYGPLMNGYYECWIEKKSEIYRSEMIKIKNELMKEKDNTINYCQGWKTKLFYFSPLLYCILVYFLRNSRELKYKVRVWTTGKN